MLGGCHYLRQGAVQIASNSFILFWDLGFELRGLNGTVRQFTEPGKLGVHILFILFLGPWFLVNFPSYIEIVKFILTFQQFTTHNLTNNYKILHFHQGLLCYLQKTKAQMLYHKAFHKHRGSMQDSLINYYFAGFCFPV